MHQFWCFLSLLLAHSVGLSRFTKTYNYYTYACNRLLPFPFHFTVLYLLSSKCKVTFFVSMIDQLTSALVPIRTQLSLPRHSMDIVAPTRQPPAPSIHPWAAVPMGQIGGSQAMSLRSRTRYVF